MRFFIFSIWLSFAGVCGAATEYMPCEHSLKPDAAVAFSGWSHDLRNARVFDQQQAGLNHTDLPALTLRWAFVFDDAVHPRSIPGLSAQAVLISSEVGEVFTIDRQLGCVYWKFQAEAEVRTSLRIERLDNRLWVFFGDQKGSAYALDYHSGALIWKRTMDEHPYALITGSPAYYQGLLYFPVSSLEVIYAANPFYNCCSFRGSVHAVDARTGDSVWKTHTISEPAKLTQRNALGVRQFGPSGAPVWSAPVIDIKRQRLYVGTGQNYSSPSEGSSDAIIAMDLNKGAIVWKYQALAQDAWNVACKIPLIGLNCPEEQGPDFDFGAAPVLVTNSQGRDFILAAQKSGDVYALDPEQQGALVWHRKLGRGGLIGGTHWGLAAQGDAVYIPIADTPIPGEEPGEANPSITKLAVDTGAIQWQTKLDFPCAGIEGCRNSVSAAITVIPGAVIAPGLDGVIHAYDEITGKEIWQFNTRGPFAGVNVSGDKHARVAKGGTLDGGGVIVADGLMLVNSGYGGIISAGGMEGNTFLVLSLAGGQTAQSPVE